MTEIRNYELIKFDNDLMVKFFYSTQITLASLELYYPNIEIIYSDKNYSIINIPQSEITKFISTITSIYYRIIFPCKINIQNILRKRYNYVLNVDQSIQGILYKNSYLAELSKIENEMELKTSPFYGLYNSPINIELVKINISTGEKIILFKSDCKKFEIIEDYDNTIFINNCLMDQKKEITSYASVEKINEKQIQIFIQIKLGYLL